MENTERKFCSVEGKNQANRIYRGITTGLNSAFIIDNQTKEALVAEDPKSAEILKPVLRGRDIQRYQAKWAGLWLIDTHNGYDNVPAIQVDDYPAIKTHLDGFYDRLERRYDQGRTPYNLRNCAYHEDFTKEKLFWMQMTDQARFAYSVDDMFGNAKVFILTGESLKYLCAVLNSRLTTWFMSNTGVTTGMGLMQWQGVTVRRIPIPRIGADSQQPFVLLLDRIIAARAASPTSDIENLELEIDRLVYGLFDLTEEEICIVEERL